jgi:signal transduction histidine kinase
LLLVAALYYGTARLGFVVASTPVPISIVWLPNALLLAAFLVARKSTWPKIIAAALPAHLAAELQSNVLPSMVAGWFVSNCAEALIGALLISLVVLGPIRFDSLRAVLAFVAFGAMAGPVLSSFLDVALIRVIGSRVYGPPDFWHLVSLRSHANMLSAVVLVPFVVTLLSEAPHAARAPPTRYVEAALLYGGLVATGVWAFIWAHPPLAQTGALVYAPLPFLLWAAVRFGPLGISTANLMLAAIALGGVVNGVGPFANGTPEESARGVQLFLLSATVPLLMLAVVLRERRLVERRAREQARQLTHLSRVAMVGGLSGALSHELGQPLTAIQSNADAARRGLEAGRSDPAELRAALSDIDTAARHARTLIERLRTLFRNGEGTMERVDANALVLEVLELCRSDFSTRGITVTMDLQPGIPAIQGDAVQLKQVLINLVINACDAMDSSSGKRVLTLRTLAPGKHSVIFCVIDRGPGLSPGMRETLFKPFHSTKPQGLGLGLYISRSIVSTHGGRLWAAAVPGQGTSFNVELPGAPEQ